MAFCLILQTSPKTNIHYNMKQSSHDEFSRQVACLYEKYSNELHLYFLSYTRDSMRADDMLQDLFLICSMHTHLSR